MPTQSSMGSSRRGRTIHALRANAGPFPASMPLTIDEFSGCATYVQYTDVLILFLFVFHCGDPYCDDYEYEDYDYFESVAPWPGIGKGAPLCLKGFIREPTPKRE